MILVEKMVTGKNELKNMKKISVKKLRIIIEKMNKERVDKCDKKGCCVKYYIEPVELLERVKKELKK